MTTNPFVQCFFLNKGRFLISTKKYVIPAKAGIQFFRNILCTLESSTGQAPQVRDDEKTIERQILNSLRGLSLAVYPVKAKSS
jgi:hypothetical protein